MKCDRRKDKRKDEYECDERDDTDAAAVDRERDRDSGWR